MNDADIKKVLERWPRLNVTQTTPVTMFRDVVDYAGYLQITVGDDGKKVYLWLSGNRETRVGCKDAEHDQAFDSIDAAMNYALVNGLLI